MDSCSIESVEGVKVSVPRGCLGGSVVDGAVSFPVLSGHSGASIIMPHGGGLSGSGDIRNNIAICIVGHSPCRVSVLINIGLDDVNKFGSIQAIGRGNGLALSRSGGNGAWRACWGVLGCGLSGRVGSSGIRSLLKT